jgi:hypothetical protein
MIGTYTFFIGLSLSVLITVFSNLYHRWRKIGSFVVITDGNNVTIRSNPLTLTFNSINLFFVYSLLGITVSAVNNTQQAYRLLVGIYVLSLMAALVHYYTKSKYKVIINRERQIVNIKGKMYSLSEFFFIIDEQKYLLLDSPSSDSYGLFITNANNRRRLVYGYSIKSDIQRLKDKIEEKLIPIA